MDAPTDEDLLQAYLAGDAAAFELLVRRHTRELYQLAVRFTGNSAAAEDVVQETFLQLHASAGRFDPARRFKPWLFTIAANKARDHLRRRDRKREVPLDAPLNAGEESGQRYIDLFSGSEAQPMEEMALEEKRRLVRGVVEQMPDRLCEVLVLAYYHRFPYREMAEILDIPLGTVKSRLHAAVRCFDELHRAAVEQHSRSK